MSAIVEECWEWEYEPPEGYSFTWELQHDSTKQAPSVVMLNVFQWAGWQCHYLRSFLGMDYRECLLEFAGYIDGLTNGPYEV